MEMSLSNRIQGYLAVKKVASYRELKDQLHEDKKKVSSTIFYLCKTRKLKRLPFSTKFGKVVYLPSMPMNLVWQYCYTNDLIPPTTALFFKMMARNKAVSTIELYNEGLDLTDIRAFVTLFTKQWKLFKIKKVNNFNVFYREESDLEKYLKENEGKITALQNKEWKRREDEGKIFEDVIEKFYQSHGFRTRRNVWFSTEDLEKVEIDIIAEKQFFDFDKYKNLVIAVQCKSWQKDRHFYSLTEFLNYYCKVKMILPNALFHVWSYNYSKYFFTSSLMRKFPDVNFFYSKHIREAFKLAEMRRV